MENAKLKKDKLKKALILAAGFGTRLRPLTDNIPKPLIEINGEPMISKVIAKLKSAGIEEIVINTHYLADKMQNYFDKNDFGLKVSLLHENQILGTGGAIKNARKYFENEADFLVYNCDVDCAIDLNDMFDKHIGAGSEATLAVKQRDTSRPLILDSNYNLIGLKNKNGEFLYKEIKDKNYRTFCGIHIINSKIYDYFPEENVFDIILVYMQMVKNNIKIVCYDIGELYWKDLGKL